MTQKALNFAERAAQAMAPTQAATAAPTAANSLPKAKIWWNFGVWFTSVDDKGDAYEDFISMPKGLPLDTMERMQANGRNVNFNQIAEASNGLLDDFLEFAADIPAGESRVIKLGDDTAASGYGIQIRRVAEDGGVAGTTASGVENPRLSAVRSIKLV